MRHLHLVFIRLWPKRAVLHLYMTLNRSQTRNAVAESFFARVKVELVHDAAWDTRAAARRELFEYLEAFYNGRRRHSAPGYLSPRAFEQQRQHEALAS
jgi:transposase InsO family protein